MKNLFKIILMFTALLGFGGVFSPLPARELPALVTIDLLTEEHDHQRVVLRDWVISGREVRTRRLDGQFTELILGSAARRKIMVVMEEELFGSIIGKCVLVQGRYRVRGKFGGFLMPGDFIVSELVMVDFSAEKTGCLFEGVGE